MSLINQMLRDLQQQKKAGGTTKPETLRPKMVERIPFLPLPVVLSGAALLLLCLVWWLAGALSDMMFGFEPTAKSPQSPQVVATEYATTTAEPDQLTMAEREAEAPVAPVASVAPVVDEPVVAKKPVSAVVPPVKTVSVDKAPPVKPVVAKAAPAIAKPSAAAISQRKQVVASPRVSAKVRPVKSRSVQAPAKTVVKAPARMHPDELPGAILSRRPAPVETQSPVLRPSKAKATTPYGMAEEAYLDGKWAYAQERSGLAVSSLKNALELYPGHLPARESLVEILGKEGKTGEAMFLLAEGLEIAPDYLGFKKKYARLLVEQGDYDTATKVMLKGGLPTVEDDPEAHVILASLYQRLEEPFLAAQTYRNLLVAWPQTGAFWVGLGGALEGQHLPEEALVCYQRALKTKDLRQDLSQYAKKRLRLLN